ncbi:YHS domain-containing protein [Actinomadura sp. 9N407]|uniref:YHS domain-containing protein n=1 Tax=Actinomadura sp. 9N407 TaxID=3375154 RepID=UPI0037A808C3
MLFIELFVPENALDADQRRQVAQGFLGSMTGGEGGMEGASADIFASQFHVVVHEPETWVRGERLLDGDGPSPYLVRVHTPGPWRKDMSEYVITAFTKLITDVDPDAAVQVHVLGVPEGGIGVRGEAKTSAALVEMMNEPLEQAYAEGRALKDPMCDMLVSPDTAPTLEWEGTLYGFCCEGCRTEFIEKQEKKARKARA